MKKDITTQTILSTDTGRSMVEMLGTLAIMGVLSIGGIAGYDYALTKYKANETMEELNNRAIMYATQMENGAETLSHGEFGNKTSLGYGVAAALSPVFEGSFNVTVSDVPAAVCVQLLKNYIVPYAISVNGSYYNEINENTSICGEDRAEMVFAFNRDLTALWEEVEVTDTDIHLTTETETESETETPTMTETLTYSPEETGTGTLTYTETGTYSTLTDVVPPDPCCDDNLCSDPELFCNSSVSSGVSGNTVSFCNPGWVCESKEVIPQSATAHRIVSKTKILGKIWVASKEKMSWYAAYNFCKAQRLEMYDPSRNIAGSDEQYQIQHLWRQNGIFSYPYVWKVKTPKYYASSACETCLGGTVGFPTGDGDLYANKNSSYIALCYGDSLDGWEE